ncbi:MAG: hypothetical protein JO125_06895 [Chloroflexi bacterium]|nr:hypothetical protein [Ktedonobacteraceae bacterium]MBV9707118.1 hypothetical protein [Chloroflexota bacterium]
MSTQAYHYILDHLQRLTPDELVQLQKDLEMLIRLQEKPKPLQNVRELRGANKETLKNMDVEEYIEEERKSWERE